MKEFQIGGVLWGYAVFVLMILLVSFASIPGVVSKQSALWLGMHVDRFWQRMFGMQANIVLWTVCFGNHLLDVYSERKNSYSKRKCIISFPLELNTAVTNL
ncbi:MAG: hypothetical protein WBB19_13765 [Desulforhopalus sp.]